MRRSRFLLVHGAWHGGWAWDLLIPELHRDGATAARVDLPSAGAGGDLAADVAVVRAALDEFAADGPVTLVGHSYGGVVISEAAAGRADVDELIYVCAFQPDVGESLFSLVDGHLPAWAQVREPVSVVLDPVTAFYADVDPTIAAAAGRRLAPQTLKSFQDPLTRAGWLEFASTYIACTQDGAIPYEAQEAMSRRATEVHTLDSSHSPFLSRPRELAGLLTGSA